MTKIIDSFIKTMEDDIKSGIPLPPSTWVSRAMKINMFIGSEIDQPLYEIESTLAKRKAEMFTDPDMTAAKANIYIEATDEYKQSKLLRGKREQVREMIRLAKKYAEVTRDELNN